LSTELHIFVMLEVVGIPTLNPEGTCRILPVEGFVIPVIQFDRVFSPYVLYARILLKYVLDGANGESV